MKLHILGDLHLEFAEFDMPITEAEGRGTSGSKELI
jgi:hypothetical protein